MKLIIRSRLRSGLAALAAFILSVTGSQATVSLTLNSNGGSPFTTSTGSMLSMGSAIRVGIFDTSGLGSLSTLQTSNVYSEVDALFTAFAEGNSGGGTINQMDAPGDMLVMNDMITPGHVFGQIIDISAAYCTTGDAIWVWVFNNADPLLATEWGIFTASTGWAFPADLASTTLSTFEVDTVVRGTNTGTQLQLSNVSVIPEPGSLILVVAAGVLLRRRRW